MHDAAKNTLFKAIAMILAPLVQILLRNGVPFRTFAELAKPPELFPRIDAFGNDTQAEAVRQIDRRTDDHVVFTIAHVHDERFIDLELIEWEST